MSIRVALPGQPIVLGHPGITITAPLSTPAVPVLTTEDGSPLTTEAGDVLVTA